MVAACALASGCVRLRSMAVMEQGTPPTEQAFQDGGVRAVRVWEAPEDNPMPLLTSAAFKTCKFETAMPKAWIQNGRSRRNLLMC